jgi:AmmeMemoRadiSam system protein B
MMKAPGIAFAVVFITSALTAQGIRPVRDDVGYCWNTEHMKCLVDYLAVCEPVASAETPFVAAVSPHDDYLYAASVYYPLFRSVKAKEVVIFGVTHAAVRKEIGDPQGILLLESYRSWTGCGRNVEISPLREFIAGRLDAQYYAVNNKAHMLEHSIEAMVPWLQYFDPGVKITPIMVTAMTFERMDEISEKLSGIISVYMKDRGLVPGRDVLFLCSSDANHYGKDFDNIPFGEDSVAHARGIEQDRRIADSLVCGELEPGKIRDFAGVMKNVVWCGKYSVPLGLLTAEKAVQRVLGKKLSGTVLRYFDSYTEGVLPLKHTGMGTTAPFSLKHWVGYLSAGFRLE